MKIAAAWFALGFGLALSPLLCLPACVSHVLGDTDTGAVRDALELDARIYRDLDGGRDRAFARGAFCSDLGVLSRSGTAPSFDAGLPIRCEVAK